MTDVTPIRTITGAAADAAIRVEPMDLLACDGPGALHYVVEKSLSFDQSDRFVIVKCRCGQTFSGALRP